MDDDIMAWATLSKERYKKSPKRHIMTWKLNIHTEKSGMITQKTAGRHHRKKDKFVKQVDREEHYLRKVGGYAIGKKVIDNLNDDTKILIKEYEDEILTRNLISYVRDWREHGQEWEHSKYERQIALEEEEMMINNFSYHEERE